MAYKLYNSNLSPFAARVRIQMYAKGLDVEFVNLPGGMSAEEFATKTPLHKVPLLETEGHCIPESQVIEEYLEEVEPGVSLMPDTPEDRARARLLARIGDLYIMIPLGKLFGQINPQGRNHDLVKQLFTELDRGLGWLGHYLDGSKYAVGDKLSIADSALLPMLFFASNITPLFGRECVLYETPKVHNYYYATLEDPSVAKVHAEVEEEFAAMMGSKR